MLDQVRPVSAWETVRTNFCLRYREIPSSWFAIDLRQGKLLPTYYTLRHGGATKMDSLRNWLLQV